jgi:photosystem II stability/assembly factor-like uncharacterized protein
LRVDPTDTSRLYLGTVSQALTSVDGGLTWFAPSGSALDRAKAVLNTDPGTPGAAVDGASAFFSEGFEGTTFATKLLDAFREASVTGVHGPVVIDSANPSNLYLPTDKGVFKSTDQGQTWRKASAGLLDLSVSSVLVDPSSPSTLVALASSGVMKSTDGGGTWLNVLPAPVLSVVMAPSSPSTLYASTASGLLVSDDSGADWSTLTTTGLPDTSVSIELVLVASDDAKTIYADVSGTEPAADGFYRSTDGGTTWSRVLDNVTAAARVVVESPGDPSILFADMFQNGLYRSDDHGGTWGQISSLAFTGFAIDPHDPSVMHGAVEGVQGKTTYLSSTDGGGTWGEMQASGLPDRVEWLLSDPNTSSVYYAVVWTEPDPGPLGTVVYRSVDGDRVPGGGLYAATDQGLYKWLPTAK